VTLAVTAAGRERSRRWLDTPVAHLREVRTELLLKLALRARAGLDSDDLLAAQQARFDPVIDALLSPGRSSHPGDPVDVWRRESARAVRRFLAQARQRSTPHPGRADRGPDPELTELRLSARNQVRATVAAVDHGDVLSTVKATLGDGQVLTAVITRDAVDELDLAGGDAVVMVVKSTEVMVAKAG
jgi:molybdopterin-binding protein